MRKRKKRKKSFLGNVTEVLETTIISFFVISMIFTYLLTISRIEGESMLNTFSPGEFVLSVKFGFTVAPGDVVIINACESVMLDENDNPVSGPGLDKFLVKRVIACEGQTIDIDFDRGIVYVDGKMLDEEYITELTHMDSGAFTGKYPLTIPEGYVFVMGDNRGVSKDSRSEDIGLVAEENVFSKVIARIFPVNKFEMIDY